MPCVPIACPNREMTSSELTASSSSSWPGSQAGGPPLAGSQQQAPLAHVPATSSADNKVGPGGQLLQTTDDDDDDCKSDLANDAEGVWSPDIEQSFQEALAIYPPCGRRKIILSDEGKMYGRNELIARYIKLRTGKTRTRKQVSSHIQVLARRKARELTNKIKDESTKQKALQSLQSMSSAQIVSAPNMAASTDRQLSNCQNVPPNFSPEPHSTPGQQQQLWGHITVGQPSDAGQTSVPDIDVKPPFIGSTPYGVPGKPAGAVSTENIVATTTGMQQNAWEGRCIGTSRFKLLEFSAFMETQGEPSESDSKHLFVHLGQSYTMLPLLEAVDIRQIYDKFPEKVDGLKDLYDKGPQQAFFLVKFWADLNTNIQDESAAFYGVTSLYECVENMTIECSTKLCSFGKQVVEKVETEFARFEDGRFVYRIHRSPMCEYMVNFIHKLKHLPEKYMMNSVLENFTVLQVVKNRDTHETLLCVAYAFEVSASEHGAQHHIYRLSKD